MRTSTSRRAGDKHLAVRYSGLDDIKIGPNEITGKVTRQVFTPQPRHASRPERDTSIRAAWGWSTTTTSCSTCWTKGFTNYRAEQSPSAWYGYLPMLGCSLGALVFWRS